MLKLQNPLVLNFAQHILLRTLKVFKVWKTQLILILSWQIGQNSFKTPIFLKLGYPISINLTFAVLKAYFQKQKPKVIKYRNYKNFENSLFRNDLLNELLSKNVQTKHLDSFKATAHFIFDRHATLKEEPVRFNQATLVNKNLRKARVSW